MSRLEGVVTCVWAVRLVQNDRSSGSCRWCYLIGAHSPVILSACYRIVCTMQAALLRWCTLVFELQIWPAESAAIAISIDVWPGWVMRWLALIAFCMQV